MIFSLRMCSYSFLLFIRIIRHSRTHSLWYLKPLELFRFEAARHAITCSCCLGERSLTLASNADASTSEFFTLILFISTLSFISLC
uniref:Uncharacterized protein n=1 Tax=Ixodes ricinus TaxID=34613 RepID=A0A6B0UFB5_IXORI